MKKRVISISVFLLSLLTIVVGASVQAQTSYYGSKDGDIIQEIDKVQQKNPIIRSIFEQKVRTYANGNAQRFGPENRIANGAWILVEAISPYVQWIVFFGMSMSVILIIYNGATIVISAGDDSSIKSAKDNITNILIGVLILGGFYFILKLVSGLLLNLVGG